MKLPAHRAELPGKVRSITRSAFLPAYKAGHPADLPVKEGFSRGTPLSLTPLPKPLGRKGLLQESPLSTPATPVLKKPHSIARTVQKMKTKGSPFIPDPRSLIKDCLVKLDILKFRRFW